ncbi:unnamed protein product, partial [Ilex paraguariensis]
DETGVYKNLLQETAHRAGLNLPAYTTVRAGPGRVPVFSCTVELAGLSFSGEPAKTKRQAQKNAAMAAWSVLKQLARRSSSSSTSPSIPSSESEGCEEQEQVVIARVLARLQPLESNNSKQNYQQRSIRTCRQPNPAGSSLYPECCAYTSFPSERTMYPLWQQAQLLQLQNHLLSLPNPSGALLNPHVLPFMQPIFQPNYLYFVAREQEFNPLGPGATIASPTRSMVTLQEIHEEKTEGSSCPSEVLDSPILGDCKMESIIQEPDWEDEQKGGGLGAKIGDSGELDRNLTGHFEWVAPKSTESRFHPVEFQPVNPYGCHSRQSIPRPHHSPSPSCQRISESPSSAPAPLRLRTTGSPRHCMPTIPTMKTGIPPYSATPSIVSRGPSPFMAPAVQIRSVVPVCSAPPATKMSSSGQDV